MSVQIFAYRIYLYAYSKFQLQFTTSARYNSQMNVVLINHLNNNKNNSNKNELIFLFKVRFLPDFFRKQRQRLIGRLNIAIAIEIEINERHIV